MVALKYILCIP